MTRAQVEKLHAAIVEYVKCTAAHPCKGYDDVLLKTMLDAFGVTQQEALQAFADEVRQRTLGTPATSRLFDEIVPKPPQQAQLGQMSHLIKPSTR